MRCSGSCYLSQSVAKLPSGMCGDSVQIIPLHAARVVLLVQNYRRLLVRLRQRSPQLWPPTRVDEQDVEGLPRATVSRALRGRGRCCAAGTGEDHHLRPQRV